jgi:hypothetical protein
MSFWGWPETRARKVALANLSTFFVFFSAGGLVGVIWGEAAVPVMHVCFLIVAIVTFPLGWIGLALLPLGPIALPIAPVFLVWNSRLWGRLIAGSYRWSGRQPTEGGPESQGGSEERRDA